MPKNKAVAMHKMPNGKMMPNKAMKPMMAGKMPSKMPSVYKSKKK